ncbi:MAG: ABC transporter substrate-binding protein/permease [Ignavibacteria bacterium]|nr:ABC transporter substrate-binding protein/permease [Ignavibacteria bacterium]
MYAFPQQQVLRWGADASGGAPYVYTDPQNPSKYIGYEKDIIEEVCKILNMKPQFVPTDWETVVANLMRNEFDVIAMGLEPTGDRAKVINFSKPYYLFRLQLTVRKEQDGITSLDDCLKQGKTVGTLCNCAASRLLDDRKIKSKAYQEPLTAYEDLELGRIDAVIMDVPAEVFYTKDRDKLKRAGSPFQTGAYVYGIRKQDTLLQAKLNTAIDTLVHNGKLEEIYRKWGMWDELQPQLAGEKATYTVTNKGFNYAEALLRLCHAAIITILLSFGAMFVALALGLPLALAQSRGPRWLSNASTVYIEFFRGTPVLVQLLFLYFGLPRIGIALPGWLTALVGLGLNYAAYESQIYRAALMSVPSGQWEVAYSLGMKPALAFRRIILPQAFRFALPPMTNDFVALFKDTSVAFAISVWELATAYRELANASQEFLFLGVIVSVFYLIMSLPLSYYAKKMEARLHRKKVELETSSEEV